jgi:predicted glycosyltransferase
MMKTAVFADTPAQLHFNNKTMKELKEHRHEARLLLRDYGETIDLADEPHLEYFVYAKTSASKMDKNNSIAARCGRGIQAPVKARPDVVTGRGVYDAFTAALPNAYCMEFEDSEPRVDSLSCLIQFKACMPFVAAEERSLTTLPQYLWYSQLFR